MHRRIAKALPCFILLGATAGVPLRCARVKIPAVVIDPYAAALKLSQQLPDVCERSAFQVQKAHHHISHLYAGVVDIVLHVHLVPGGAQQAHKRIAQDCIAQMADVRGLVGINAGVLDQCMTPGQFRRSLRRRRSAF